MVEGLVTAGEWKSWFWMVALTWLSLTIICECFYCGNTHACIIIHLIFSLSSLTTKVCEKTKVKSIARGSCPIQLFCDDSASMPRGVVYHPVNLTGHYTSSCLHGSTVVDVHDPPPTSCSSIEPTMWGYSQLSELRTLFCTGLCPLFGECPLFGGGVISSSICVVIILKYIWY